MYHGSLVERNGLDLAIDALARVRDSIPYAELRICGRKTPFLEKVLEEARRRSLESRVHYLGPRSVEGLVQKSSSAMLELFQTNGTPSRKSIPRLGSSNTCRLASR